MQQIVTSLATEGMVLAQEVLTPEGRVLCGKGTELTASILERLKRMEIPYITVEGHPFEVEGEKTLEDELRDLEARFSRVEKIAPLMYLKKKIREKLIASRS